MRVPVLGPGVLVSAPGALVSARGLAADEVVGAVRGAGSVETCRTPPTTGGSGTTVPCVVSFSQRPARSGATVSWTGPGGAGRSRPTGRSVAASRMVTPPVRASGM
ncbi:hypothetical protein AB0J52_22075 [Spirillospora sp. NPDC049652]